MLCLGWSVAVTAQQLPHIQTGNQWLPATSQIDGKLSEWKGMLQAYNKATRMEYTMANDNKNLYLAIRSTDKAITAKILAGGISFLLNTSGKNNVNERPVITFPATNSIRTSGTNSQSFKILTDSTDIRKAILNLKGIKTLRYKGITDSLVSIYNPYGIKTKLSYSNKALIAELIIPLNLIGLSYEESAAFTYTIRLNGVPYPIYRGEGVSPPPMGAPKDRNPEPYLIADEVRSPTYFSGQYNLLKK